MICEEAGDVEGWFGVGGFFGGAGDAVVGWRVEGDEARDC